MIRGSNLSLDVGVRLNDEGLVFLELDKAREFERSVARRGDLVFTCWGTIGQVGLIDERARYPEYAVSNKQMKLTPNRELVDSLYLYYWLSSPRMVTEVVNRSIGAAVPGFNLGQLRELPVALPPLGVQRAIAATLGALDDKIDSNRRVVELIPALIRASIDGACADDSEQTPVANLARFVNGGAYTNDATGTGRMVLRIAELNSGPGGSTIYNDLDVPDDQTARPGDILMSWSGSLGIYRWSLSEAIINQHIFKVLPNEGFPPWRVFDRLSAVMPEFQDIAKDKATTMGHIQRGHLESTTIAFPTTDAIARLDTAMSPLWARLLAAEVESHKLTTLRDALLPELLSGRVKVEALPAEILPAAG